ncbi:membrane protein [Flavobacterium noncentrifugens]|uniref:CarboxypepD_reg-like domain-containing protein n=1 Tax=Flavobacterium noncentrifugens TaxID=1128970 RepID=A0A1G8T0Z9_9FLAO|nr:carboxypeptidase-like regulatory domain-containing protein [Flavobacterium noncentrifugens]GEP50020.1 membrane protein [Flavobacterium noncentrifugens]SDJ34410.1 CarboxypepD_reg-like domain-containing protein [Flavobacterium noncentrifugens]
MKNSFFFGLLFFVGFSALAQIRGVVKDSIDGKPVPYVTISVENENFGTTSEENGEFKIHVSDKSKKLVFSALGFERKTVSISDVSEVRLKPTALQLDEVVISKRFETQKKEIGEPENAILETFDKAPRIDIKFFPYDPSYKKTRYLKQVVLVTDSKINDATFKIHFYSVDANGYPGEELLEKDFIVAVDKGVSKTKFNVSKFNLIMPKTGLFVGFEKLLIDKNSVEKMVMNYNTNEALPVTTYYPFMLYNNVKRNFQFVFIGGKWIRKSNPDQNNPADKIRIYEPAITIILTN